MSKSCVAKLIFKDFSSCQVLEYTEKGPWKSWKSPWISSSLKGGDPVYCYCHSINLFYILSFSTNKPNGNLRTEPKYVVFLSQLFLLFYICPSCKADNPLVETTECGTMVTVHTHCGNPECKQRESVWHSQPNMEGTKIAAGNFLLRFAILLAGASASKVLTVFYHMGLSCISLRTFYNHQRVRLTFIAF